MTADLKQYIDSLNVQVYRMIDGSVILSEENHRDSVESYVILHRPLQICQMIVESSLKTVYVPWIPGGQTQIKVNLDSIIAEADSTFDQKFAYSRYFLLTHLQKYLSPSELQEAIKDSSSMNSSNSNQMPSLSPSLKHQLNKQKRFDLN
jgi:hypothetical protein